MCDSSLMTFVEVEVDWKANWLSFASLWRNKSFDGI
jgi:hypothetical protein